jgi:hypothetical protein
MESPYLSFCGQLFTSENLGFLQSQKYPKGNKTVPYRLLRDWYDIVAGFSIATGMGPKVNVVIREDLDRFH